MFNLKLWLSIAIIVVIIGLIVGVVLGLNQGPSQEAIAPETSAGKGLDSRPAKRPAIQDEYGNYTQEYEEGRAAAFEAIRQEVLQENRK